jgi:hypothetical protein
MVEQVNLQIKKNDTWSRTLYFENEDKEDIDITGWKIYFMVKTKIDDLDASAVISKTISTFTSPTTGEAVIELTSTDTNLLGNYLFAIKVITDNMVGVTKEAITVLEGTIDFTNRIIEAVS